MTPEPDQHRAPRAAPPGPPASPSPLPSPVPSPSAGPAGSAAAGRPTTGVVRGLLLSMRPRQWVKNLLVLAAPLAGGTLLEPGVLRDTAVAFALFCVVSAGVYLVNDARDVEEDRRHPRKRLRPIAAGAVPVGLAVAVGVGLLVTGLTASALLTRPALAGVLGAYVAISLAYSLFLRHEPVIDLAVVASGFVLRGVAGGAAAGVAPSQWFLLVALFGALFMVAGKRYAELVLLGEDAGTRRSLGGYSASYLRFVWSLSAAVTCTVYCLWAFELRQTTGAIPWSTISIAPFVLGLLRYAVDVDRGAAGSPEDIVLRDRVLLGLGLVWAAVFVLGVVGG
ncbi:decaprenyl-phosphate phosphoribosyltransferase [Blastococcus sp. SYSU D00695]